MKSPLYKGCHLKIHIVDFYVSQALAQVQRSFHGNVVLSIAPMKSKYVNAHKWCKNIFLSVSHQKRAHQHCDGKCTAQNRPTRPLSARSGHQKAPVGNAFRTSAIACPRLGLPLRPPRLLDGMFSASCGAAVVMVILDADKRLQAFEKRYGPEFSDGLSGPTTGVSGDFAL